MALHASSTARVNGGSRSISRSAAGQGAFPANQRSNSPASISAGVGRGNGGSGGGGASPSKSPGSQTRRTREPIIRTLPAPKGGQRNSARVWRTAMSADRGRGPPSGGRGRQRRGPGWPRRGRGNNAFLFNGSLSLRFQPGRHPFDWRILGINVVLSPMIPALHGDAAIRPAFAFGGSSTPLRVMPLRGGVQLSRPLHLWQHRERAARRQRNHHNTHQQRCAVAQSARETLGGAGPVSPHRHSCLDQSAPRPVNA